MSKTIIGIDPGAKGVICVTYENKWTEFFPLADFDWDQICTILNDFRDQSYGEIIACMEEVHAVQGSSAKGTFSFAEGYGILKGVLTALAIPYVLVPPKKWQSEIWTASDKVYINRERNVIDTKGTSLKAAKRLFPHIDFKRTPRCVKCDDNKVDSMLIAEYARRKNL